jgi:hypothetical protein
MHPAGQSRRNPEARPQSAQFQPLIFGIHRRLQTALAGAASAVFFVCVATLENIR